VECVYFSVFEGDIIDFGQMEYQGETVSACCAKPDLDKCYLSVGFLRHPAVICNHCGEVTQLKGSTVRKFIWDNFIAIFWKGIVVVPVKHL